MRIACEFDHAGVPLHDAVADALAEAGHEALDLGAICDGEVERGGSGAGVAVAATKVHGIRAATVSDTYTADRSVEHDDLNALCLGARVIGPELARAPVRAFAGAQFSGAERHLGRLAEVAAIERDGVDAPSNRNHAA